MRLYIRNIEKFILQYLLLPLCYEIFRFRKIDDKVVIFADAKHNDIPYSLRSMYDEVSKRNYKVLNYCFDYSNMSVWKKLYVSMKFMALYAKAKYVFLCDYYLPTASCNKKRETKVVQLWHASGLQKKFGFDAIDDLGNYCYINPVKNYDLVSVSADIMKLVISHNWRLPLAKIQALGCSRTDIFFTTMYVQNCRDKFYSKYPEARGKNIILWAPSFRGNGGEPYLNLVENVINIKKQLSKNIFFIIKLHPNLQEKYEVDNCELPTEELYPVVDILITDYSSVLYDYMLFGSNVIFYVPDYNSYILNRGMYIDYSSEFEYPIVRNEKELLRAIYDYKPIEKSKIRSYRNKFIKMNDGKSSDRIITYLENLSNLKQS